MQSHAGRGEVAASASVVELGDGWAITEYTEPCEADTRDADALAAAQRAFKARAREATHRALRAAHSRQEPLCAPLVTGPPVAPRQRQRRAQRASRRSKTTDSGGDDSSSGDSDSDPPAPPVWRNFFHKLLAGVLR